MARMGKFRRWWRRRDWDLFRLMVLWSVGAVFLAFGPESSGSRRYPPEVRLWAPRVFVAFVAIVDALGFYSFLTTPDGTKDEDGNPLGLSILPRRDTPTAQERNDDVRQPTKQE